MAKVSVIVPVYKVEKYLNRCIESIVNQTLADIEIILVDDGSPDRCGEICDEWAKKDGRIKAIHQLNKGVSVARNVGMSTATSKYICFVDSDDVVEPGYVEKMFLPMEQNQLDLVVCGISHRYSVGSAVLENKIADRLTGVFWKDFPEIRESCLGPCCKLFLKEKITDNDINFPEGMCHGEDQVFSFTYYKYVKKYCYVNEALYQYWHRDSDSLTSQGVPYVDTVKYAVVYDLMRQNMKIAKVEHSDETVNSYIVADITSTICAKRGLSERIQQIILLRSKLDFGYSVFGLKYKIVMWFVRYRIYFPLFAYGWLKRKMRG